MLKVTNFILFFSDFSLGGLSGVYTHTSFLEVKLEQENVKFILYASNFHNVGANSSSSAGFFLPVGIFSIEVIHHLQEM